MKSVPFIGTLQELNKCGMSLNAGDGLRGTNYRSESRKEIGQWGE